MVPRVRPVPMADQANQACPATTHRFRWTKRANAAGAHQDQTDHPDHQAPEAQLASKDTQVLQAKPARTDHKDHPDHLAQQAKKAKMAKMARKANLERMPNAVIRAPTDPLARLENPVPPDLRARKDQRANQATRPTTDHLAHLVKEANRATREPRDHRVPRANLVRMPIIVLARREPPRLPPRPPKFKKRNDPREDARSIFSIVRAHLGLTSAFNIGGDYPKFSIPVLSFTIHTTTNFG